MKVKAGAMHYFHFLDGADHTLEDASTPRLSFRAASTSRWYNLGLRTWTNIRHLDLDDEVGLLGYFNG